ERPALAEERGGKPAVADVDERHGFGLLWPLYRVGSRLHHPSLPGDGAAAAPALPWALIWKGDTVMAQQDAIALLDADHMHVDQLFAEYQTAGDDRGRKKQLAHQICQELTTHARIEEEIFYPAVRKATGDNQMLDGA